MAILLLTLTPLSVYAQVDSNASFDIESNTIANWPQGPDLLSSTGVLMEIETGEVLYDKGMNELRYPASITKVMTALLALENSEPTDEVTFTASALQDMSLGTNIGMQEGEVLTMKQCLQVLMIKSANEVANQIGEYIGGSQAEFAKMMNEKAATIGCKNTNFVNASGMPDDNHYTTAYDMALIFREALKNKDFRKLIGKTGCTIPPTNKNPEKRSYHSSHAVFVEESSFHYKGCIGGKTGVTQEAHNTLVTGVKRGNIGFIAVVMRADDHASVCTDTISLFDYVYNNFELINETESSLLTPKGTKDQLEITEEAGDNANEIIKTYSLGEHALGTVRIISDNGEVTEAPETEQPASLAPTQVPTSTKTPLLNNEKLQSLQTPQMIILVLAILILLNLSLVVTKIIKNKKKL